MMRISSIRRRWPFILLLFMFSWLIFTFSNFNGIDNQVPSESERHELSNIEINSNVNKDDVKFDGAELEVEGNKVESVDINKDEDRAVEHGDPFDFINSDENIVKVPIQDSKVNPRILELANEERWGLDKVPEVNLSQLAVINGPEEEVRVLIINLISECSFRRDIRKDFVIMSSMLC